MPTDTSLTDFCNGITDAFCDIYRQNGLDMERLENKPQERMTASAVIYSNYRKEIWMIGDCLCMVDGKLHKNEKPYENELAERRANIILDSTDKEAFLIHDTAREAIIPDMLIAMQEQNKTFAVIDGFPIPQDMIKVIAINSDDKEIVLASDGYPFLAATLSESEKRLKEQMSHDPLNIMAFKATKGTVPGNLSFDDRAYIRFSV